MAGLPATNTVTESAAMLSMIERLSQNPSVDVAKMESLLRMWERIRDKNAEMAFTRDYAALSMDLPRIQKNGVVSYDKVKGNPAAGKEEAFKFALYEDVDEVIRPAMNRFGFTLGFTAQERASGGLIINGILSHRDGHSRIVDLPLALDTSGGKNNLQAMTSSSSYGRRISACILLNIIAVGEDDDGQANGAAKTL